MLKKVSIRHISPIVLSLAALGIFSYALVFSTTAHAATCDNNDTVIIDCGNGTNGIWALLLIAINVLTAGVGVLAVAGIVYGAFLWTTAEDMPDQLNKAKSIITNVIIGLLAFAGMYAVLQFVIPGGVFDRSSKVASITNTTDSTLKIPSSNQGGPSSGNSQSPADNSSTFTPGQVLIIGDSITQRPATGTNQGNKGWWEYLLDGKSGRFKFSAEGGSGYVVRGSRGTTFYDRLSDISSTKPKSIVIAGGLNDRGAQGLSSGIKKYYDQLAKVLATNNIPVTNVYVLVPHPSGTAADVIAIVKSNATRIGAKFVSTSGYTSLYDNLHPDSAGAKVIEQSFTKNSNFDERLK